MNHPCIPELHTQLLARFQGADCLGLVRSVSTYTSVSPAEWEGSSGAKTKLSGARRLGSSSFVLPSGDKARVSGARLLGMSPYVPSAELGAARSKVSRLPGAPSACLVHVESPWTKHRLNQEHSHHVTSSQIKSSQGTHSWILNS